MTKIADALPERVCDFERGERDDEQVCVCVRARASVLRASVPFFHSRLVCHQTRCGCLGSTTLSEHAQSNIAPDHVTDSLTLITYSC